VSHPLHTCFSHMHRPSYYIKEHCNSIGGGRGQWLEGAPWMCVARAYNGGLGADPPAGSSRSRVPGQGSGGEAPLKLKTFWSLDVQRSRQIWLLSKNVISNFVTCNKVLNHCRVIDAIQNGLYVRPCNPKNLYERAES